ncbi:DHS-like NAD/FAD-binding domain-containing protein [Schizophyllum commune]
MSLPSELLIYPPATLEAASARISLVYKNTIFHEDEEENGSAGASQGDSGSFEASVEQSAYISWPPTASVSRRVSRSRVNAADSASAAFTSVSRISRGEETQDETQSSAVYSDSSSIAHFPTFRFSLHALNSLSELHIPGKPNPAGSDKPASNFFGGAKKDTAKSPQRRVTLLLAILEVDGPDSVRVKTGADAGKEVSVLRMVMGDEAGKVCKLTAWREVADAWASAGVRRGDVVLLENVNAACEPGTAPSLTASPSVQSRLEICYRTMPTERVDYLLRPDLRLGGIDPAVRRVEDVVRCVPTIPASILAASSVAATKILPAEAAERVATFLAPGDVTVITGAGISVDSGIRAYRGHDGRYMNPNYKPIFYHELVDPTPVGHLFRQRYWLRSYLGYPPVRDALPNTSHYALAALQHSSIVTRLVTQNVDGLHHRALARVWGPAQMQERILELHGTLHQVRCRRGHLIDRGTFQDWLSGANPQWKEFADDIERTGQQPRTNPDGDVAIEHLGVSYKDFVIPECPTCLQEHTHNNVHKPEVIFFGESIPEYWKERSIHDVEHASRVMLIGTTLATYSAFRLVKHALELKKPVLLLNVGPTRADGLPGVEKIEIASGAILRDVVRLVLKAGGCRDPHKGPRAARVLAPTTFPLPFLTFPTAVVAAVLNVRRRQQHPRLQQVSRGPPASQVSPALPAAPAPLLATSSPRPRRPRSHTAPAAPTLWQSPGSGARTTCATTRWPRSSTPTMYNAGSATIVSSYPRRACGTSTTGPFTRTDARDGGLRLSRRRASRQPRPSRQSLRRPQHPRPPLSHPQA